MPMLQFDGAGGGVLDQLTVNTGEVLPAPAPFVPFTV
jgi:hypothetical protein